MAREGSLGWRTRRARAVFEQFQIGSDAPGPMPSCKEGIGLTCVEEDQTIRGTKHGQHGWGTKYAVRAGMRWPRPNIRVSLVGLRQCHLQQCVEALAGDSDPKASQHRPEEARHVMGLSWDVTVLAILFVGLKAHPSGPNNPSPRLDR